MAKVYWVTCPDCGRRYYVSTSLQEQKVELMCPFCKKFFDNPGAQS
ncbi:MAG: zinc ribbon domain-containing protein [Chloroflexi bacterium]|nr:zinc ribbon domain-containing protein [Chloroflexota bacterium]